MKSVSLLFSTEEYLNVFIQEKKLNDSQNLLVQIFSGIFDRERILNIVKVVEKLLPQARIIGCTTSGEICNGISIEKSVLLVFTAFTSTQIRTGIIDFKQNDEYGTGKELAKDIFRPDSRVFLVFTSNSVFDSGRLFSGFDFVTSGVPVAGGVSTFESDAEYSDCSFVFAGDSFTDNGVVAASLSGNDLQVYSDLCFDWIPIGKEYTITKAAPLQIVEIDGIPARLFYEDHIGRPLLPGSSLGGIFPFLTDCATEMRSIPVSAIENSQALKTLHTVKTGTKLRIGYGNRIHILAGAEKMISGIGKQPGESIFVYSCINRKKMLGDLTDIELSPLIAGTSVNGFYANGEFNNTKGKNIKCEQTLTVLVLSESDTARIPVDITSFNSQKLFINEEESALHFLLQTAGDELHVLSANLKKQVESETKQLRFNYFHDTETGLQNMNKMVADTESAVIDKLALIYIPVLLEYSIFYGRKIYTELQKQIGLFAEENFSGTDSEIYLLGQETFAVGSSYKISEDSFITRCAAFQKSLKNHCFQNDSIYLYLNPVMGLACCTDDIINKATMVLHYAMRMHLEFILYDESLSLKVITGNYLVMIGKLRDAIRNDRIVPYFQPIFDNASGKVTKYEALVRMIDKDGKVLLPSEFLEIAKYAGIYTKITRIIVKKVFDKMEKTPYEFSINITLSDILERETRDFIIEKLERSSAARQVVFELLESERIEKFSEVIPFITKVKRLGAKIAIDDFGSGYSNLVYLAKLNSDYLKLDGTIISGVLTDAACENIVKLMKPFAKANGQKIIAEFVSSSQLQKKMEELGIDFSQGYYIGEPSEDII